MYCLNYKLFLQLCKKISLAQKHRVIEVKRDLRRSSGPNPLAHVAHAGALTLAGCPGPCPDGFWVSPKLETPQSPWPTCSHVQSPLQSKSVTWCSDRASCFSFHAFSPLTGHQWKWPISALFAPSPQAFICIEEIPLSLLSSRLNSPSSHSLSV